MTGDLGKFRSWLREQVPDGAVSYIAPIEDHRASLFPEEAKTQVKAVERRQKEFSTGRYLARRALGDLGFAEAPILIGERRQPVWPDGVRATITHSQGICVVIAAQTPQIRALGLDLEGVAGVSDDVARYVSTPQEMDKNAAQLPKQDLKAAVFSIREAIFKAYYPRTGVYLNFSDVTLELDGTRGHFMARITNDACPALFGQRQIDGQFLIADGLVLSLVAL